MIFKMKTRLMGEERLSNVTKIYLNQTIMTEIKVVSNKCRKFIVTPMK